MLKRIAKLLLALTFHGFEKFLNFVRSTPQNPATCVVLMYHDVPPAYFSRFVWQMETLRRLAIPIEVESIDDLKGGKHHVALTFDDGFAATIEMVIPVLAEKVIPATFFIPTAYLGKEALWNRYLHRKGGFESIVTVESLKVLANRSVVTIGSHGVHHRRLTEMEDQIANFDLVESKLVLENITGKCLKLYSFPYGIYDNRHLKMAYQAGYEHVFSIDPLVVTEGRREFVVGRTQVDPSDWALEFILKVLGSYRWHPFVSRLKKHLWPMYLQISHSSEHRSG